MKALAYNSLAFDSPDLHDFLENAGVKYSILTQKAAKALSKRVGLPQKGAACLVLEDKDAAVATAAVLKFPEVRVINLPGENVIVWVLQNLGRRAPYN